jgi:hypothetical protein
MTRELLPKSYWRYWFEPANECVQYDRIIVGCYVKGPKRTLSYQLFPLSDLPNDFVGAEDLECILSNLDDRSTMHRFETLPNYRVGTHAVGPNLI